MGLRWFTGYRSCYAYILHTISASAVHPQDNWLRREPDMSLNSLYKVEGEYRMP